MKKRDLFAKSFEVEGVPRSCQRRDGPKCHMVAAVACPHALTCWLMIILGNEQAQTAGMAGLLLGCSTRSVWRLVKSGKLHPLPRIAGGVRFSFDEVMRYKAEAERAREVECNRQF